MIINALAVCYDGWMKGFTKRDYLVAAAIIIGVLGAWCLIILALFHLFLAGFAAVAWIILIILTFAALKRKK